MAKDVHGASCKKRKKRRWTKEEKRNRIQPIGAEHTCSVEKTRIEQFEERVLKLAVKFQSNGKGVRILKNFAMSDSGLAIRTVSSSLLQQLEHDHCPLPPLPEAITIVRKPLLICDINGILCHRVRADHYPNIPYRESTKKVSGTPVIPRPGLDDFLEFLARHFWYVLRFILLTSR